LTSPGGCSAGTDFAARHVTSSDDLADVLWPQPPAPPHLTRGRLHDLEQDARFCVSYVEVAAYGRPVLALPCYSPCTDRWPDAAYDVSARLGLAPGLRADSFCLAGGRADFRCAALEARRAPPDVLDAAASTALRSACEAAGRDGRSTVLLYADADGRLCREAVALGTHDPYTVLAQRYVIPDVGSGLESYLSALGRSRRSVVRRDLRDLAASGIKARPQTWETVVTEAAPLIAGVHQAHGQRDLPALALARLRRRARDPDVSGVAFAVWLAGQLIAVTVGWVYGRTLELYEVGLAAQPAADRGLRYLEVMFYAPLRFMWREGLRTLDVALESGYPKRLRGAVGRPVVGLILGSGAAGPGQR
jgi:hypothetical protein